MSNSKQAFFLLNHNHLISWLKEHKQPAYRHKQILEFIYKKNIDSFFEIPVVPKALQTLLDEAFYITPFKSTKALESQDKSATKYVFTCLDGKQIEAVVLAEKSYKTLCISSQVGCPVGCTFCLTGTLNLIRQLKTEEIIGQFHQLKKIHPSLSHIVFMGMGEPLLNLKAVLPSLNTFTSESMFNLSKRHITVSTSGYLAGLKTLLKNNIILNLAFSVGHANPVKRKRIMPYEEKNPILECARILKEYQTTHNRKLTLEYTLLKGFNEDDESLSHLANLAKYLNAKVNLINLNPHPKIPHQPISVPRLKACQHYLKQKDLRVTIRYTKGQDIVAACGQLGESVSVTK